MHQALCIHARLCAAVGIGDGGSEGKHDRKHQSDMGLVDWCHHKIRCACCLFSNPCFCNYCFCIDIAKQSKAVIIAVCFSRHECMSKAVLLNKCMQLLCAEAQCSVVTQHSFCAVKAYQTCKHGLPPPMMRQAWVYARHDGHVDGGSSDREFKASFTPVDAPDWQALVTC